MRYLYLLSLLSFHLYASEILSIPGAPIHEPFIRDPDRCNSDISNGGGDYKDNVVQLRAKCSNGGLPVELRNVKNNSFLFFSTDSTSEISGRTRTELAVTRTWFNFREPIFIGFKIMIPKESEVTNQFFYLMQWWQCAPNSPIAGIRVERGSSHNINFMTRGDKRGSSMSKFSLKPDIWYPFVIKGVVDPSGKLAEFSVWNSPLTRPKTFLGSYGYSKKLCNQNISPPQHFRLKFGIYKGAESGKFYSISYDDLSVGRSFESVSPW